MEKHRGQMTFAGWPELHVNDHFVELNANDYTKSTALYCAISSPGRYKYFAETRLELVSKGTTLSQRTPHYIPDALFIPANAASS